MCLSKGLQTTVAHISAHDTLLTLGNSLSLLGTAITKEKGVGRGREELKGPH